MEQQLACDIVRIRRRLHAHPELSHQEFATADFIEGQLRSLGRFEVFRPAPTSVCALFGAHGPVIAVRADIDALPINELGTCDYRSLQRSVMHACGHDGHTAALLGVASVLAKCGSTNGLNGRSVLLIFQQAEESHPSGAPLVLAGLPADISLIRAYGFHLWPELAVGTVGLVDGPLMAAIDGLVVHVEGEERGPSHGTRAESLSIDAIEVLLNVYQELRPQMHRRSLSVEHPTTIHFGQIEGGQGPNQVAKSARLRGTLRTIDPHSRQVSLARVEEVVKSTCLRHGATGRVEVSADIRPHLVNDARAVSELRAAALASGAGVVRYPEHPLGISEDFGWYLKRCPGAFMLVGCTKEGASPIHLHHPNFDFDEQALLICTKTLVTLIGGAMAESDPQ